MQRYSEISVEIKKLKFLVPEIIFKEHINLFPELQENYTPHQREMYLEDTAFHIEFLAEAVSHKEPALFVEYTSWLKSFFSNINVPHQHIILNLQLLEKHIKLYLPAEIGNLASLYLNTGINNYSHILEPVESFIRTDNPLADSTIAFLDHLLNNRKHEAFILVMSLVEKKVSIKDIYLNLFQPVQLETGRLWQLNKISVAQEHYITAIIQLIMSRLYTYIFTGEKREKKIVVACVNGEMHELPARMVADIFELEGWDSVYLGANTPPKSLLDTLSKQQPDLLAISVTMTFNVSSAARLIEQVRENKLFSDIKILVGGSPFKIAPDLWKKIGADGFAPDAMSAVTTAQSLVRKNAR